MLLTRNRHTRSLTLPDTIDLAGPGTFGGPAAMSDDGRVVDATFGRGSRVSEASPSSTSDDAA